MSLGIFLLKSLFTKENSVLFSLFGVNYLKAYRHILVKLFPVAYFAMFFEAFKRTHENIFDNVFHIIVTVFVNHVHQFDVICNDVDFRFFQKRSQIIDCGLNNACKITFYRQLVNFISESWIEKFQIFSGCFLVYRSLNFFHCIKKFQCVLFS